MDIDVNILIGINERSSIEDIFWLTALSAVNCECIDRLAAPGRGSSDGARLSLARYLTG